MPTLKLSYLVGDKIAALSTDAGLLKGVAKAGSAPIAAWIAPLAEAAPRGLMNLYLSPKAAEWFVDGPQLKQVQEMGSLGATMSLILEEDGLAYEQTELFSKEGPIASALSAGGKIPPVSDGAFSRIPADSLMAIAVGSPAGWLKAVGGMAAPLMASGDKQMGELLKLVNTVFDGDVTIGLRTLLPLPSGIVTVSGADEATTTKKLDALKQQAKSMKLPLTEVTAPNGSRR